jgi:hemoglobin
MKIGMFVLAAALAACGAPKNRGDNSSSAGGTLGAPQPAGGTLYDRLGGKDAIAGVVKEFVENQVAKDVRINAFFANADIPGLETKLTDQLCQATGGPCKYAGKDMRTAHTGMNIKDADFNALVEDLTKALDKFKVPDKEKGELLGALAGMKGDIVGH